MKLEEKFFKSFFYPFLICSILSTLIVTTFLGLFTNTNYDKRTNSNIINLETKYSKINIKSVNTILTTILLKIQASLNEQILYYQRMAKKVINTEISELNLYDTLFKCVYELTSNFLKENIKNLDYMGYWYILDGARNFNEIKDERAKKQLISFSNIMNNLYSTLAAFPKGNSVYEFFFFFEETDLFISFPVSYDYEYDYLSIFDYYDENPFWCVNNEGKIYNIYNIKCRDFYQNIQKAKSKIYDINYKSDKNRTIFVTNFYAQLDIENSPNVYTICIQFLDPITNGNAYTCCDVNQEDLIYAFDILNSNLKGYYFISSIGFNYVFFFPQGRDEPKTITENLFRWDVDYFLEEKTYFLNNFQKKLTSNYENQINIDNFEEVYLNGKNSSEQYISINNEKFKFEIYPVVLENLYGEKEHVLSIIYIYNTTLYLNKLIEGDTSMFIKIILELIIFIIFGWGLLHIIILTFNTLVKYIVIPVKNVNYMLKGINIGGINRLNFIKYLKKKQDDNLEKLENMYIMENKKINEDLSDINLLQDNYNNNNENNNKTILKEYNQKYDEESNYIEKEINFYDFDDALLQYRSLEIEKLVKSLIDLKGALILTSKDQPKEQIIDYSYSENIFKNFKNIEGTSICQSNIGNLQIQLMKFDKAIYHLALSLQDNKLKKYLSRTLSDELDENDSLLNRISYTFNKAIKKEKDNILVEKQQSKSSDNFSQKIIGIFINTRYNRLIYSYYKFFKVIKKLQKLNEDDINGQYMNTYFHTINYYHKIIIQYIYLSFVKNDLIKIGESILDYIEFLIKFKFKTNSENTYFLKVQNKDRQEYRDKQKLKKKIFDKIINWFNLFDDYIIYVKDNTSLGDDKTLMNDFSHNYENKEFNSSNQTIFLFRVNIQRNDYLKGKFSLCCKNYNDALYYFIHSAKKKSLVIDGLIKKKSLKNIIKILSKVKKSYEEFGLIKLNLKEKYNEFNKEKNKNKKKILNKKFNEENNDYNIHGIFKEEIQEIKDKINNDIGECNAKQEKDIIILIDFNIYNKTENNDMVINIDKLDAFIAQTNSILINYLSSNDRFSVFVYFKQYHIICPLINKYQIDIQSFSKDLFNYKNIIYSEKKDLNDEFNINLEEITDFKNIEFELGGKDFNEYSQEIEENSSEENIKIENKYKIIEGLINTINYINNYLEMKESIKNEKYIILFTDLFNSEIPKDDNIKNIFNKLKENKEVIFLLVGKNKVYKNENNNNILDELNDEDKYIIKLIINKFGDKSEIINFENMTKIKNILSHNNVIKDVIIYPNEIYK